MVDISQLEARLVAMEQQRNDAVALNVLYHRSRHDHRDFAKNAQAQRDDWMQEAEKLRAEQLCALYPDDIRELKERLIDVFGFSPTDKFLVVLQEQILRLMAENAKGSDDK